MKTTFRPNIKIQGPSLKIRRRPLKKSFVLGGTLVALILVAIIFQDFSFRLINRPVMYIAGPFLKMRSNLENWWNGFKAGFEEKKALQDENALLREKLLQMETTIALGEILKKENETLKAAFSAGEKQNFLLASIIFRPPQTPYDMLIVDFGSKNGAREGMQVSAFGNVLLGYAADVFDDMSKIKLISSFGEETNVFLESSGIPAIAVGRGGENFEIALPRAISVEIGEKIITLGKQPMLVGIVEKIEHQTTDPFQKIFFRLPVNIQYLNQVFLLKK